MRQAVTRLQAAVPPLPDELPEAAVRYVGKVRRHAYRVVDADVVEALRSCLPER